MSAVAAALRGRTRRTATTLVELLREAADRHPDDVLYTFLADGESQEESITYAELDRRARAVAAELHARGAAGERVLLLYPPGLEYVEGFFGCVYAGALAVPAYPPFNDRQAGRVQAVVEDAAARFVLSARSVASWARLLRVRRRAVRWVRRLPLAGRWLGREAASEAWSGRLAEHLEWICTSDVPTSSADAWRDPLVEPRDVAFLQYTSGSTAAPKGVMPTHASLLHNLGWIATLFGLREGAGSVSWLPPYHDLGLIGQLLVPLYRRMPTLLMPPESFLKRPLRWLTAIARHGAELSGGPNFAYDLCVRKIGEAERARLDLRSWRVAFNAAEPVRPETLERFARAFAPCGFDPKAFFPCYGMAEGTLVVSFGDPSAAPVVGAFRADALEEGRAIPASPDAPGTRRLVSCGRSAPDQCLAIVDPATRLRLPSGRVGEIWVSGPSVAAGYWRRADVTQETFGARTADTGEGPFLRTGDLGFEAGGELFVIGRLKDLILIRGRNHYPEDIEQTVSESRPELRAGCGAAFGVEQDGQERLVIVQEVRARGDRLAAAEIVSAMRHGVWEAHGLEVHGIVLLRPGTIPKTSSGKVQRRASREAFLRGALQGVATWSR